jgi:ADP-L-glycero-D-manno-heptose 6-epimerase
MFIVTGGAGFIGSAFVWKLNQMGIDDVLIVDDLGHGEKWKNLRGLKYADYVHKSQFLKVFLEGGTNPCVEALVHMGACSSTTETDAEYLMDNNYRYTQGLVAECAEKGIRFINASSAATYGDGSLGFSDDETDLGRLRPLNMYGYTKQLLDVWAQRNGLLDKMASLKFFNVFGPNEYHKDSMRSVVCKAYEQITETGRLTLFRSHRPDYADGEQKRDFVSVKDCVDVMWWLVKNPEVCGIFNLGTGTARSFNDLGRAVFAAMGREPAIDYVDTPEAIRAKYQYYTRAEMDKLRAAGYEAPFTPLEEAVADYVGNHLAADDPYLTT